MGIHRAAITRRASATGILLAAPTTLIAQVAAGGQWSTTLGLLGIRRG
jgi:hypothetical protein